MKNYYIAALRARGLFPDYTWGVGVFRPNLPFGRMWYWKREMSGASSDFHLAVSTLDNVVSFITVLHVLPLPRPDYGFAVSHSYEGPFLLGRSSIFLPLEKCALGAEGVAQSVKTTCLSKGQESNKPSSTTRKQQTAGVKSKSVSKSNGMKRWRTTVRTHYDTSNSARNTGSLTFFKRRFLIWNFPLPFFLKQTVTN